MKLFHVHTVYWYRHEFAKCNAANDLTFIYSDRSISWVTSFLLKAIWIRSTYSFFSFSFDSTWPMDGCRLIIRSSRSMHRTNLPFFRLPLWKHPLKTHICACVHVIVCRCAWERYECVIAAQSTPSSINELASIYLLLHHWNPYFSPRVRNLPSHWFTRLREKSSREINLVR